MRPSSQMTNLPLHCSTVCRHDRAATATLLPTCTGVDVDRTCLRLTSGGYNQRRPVPAGARARNAICSVEPIFREVLSFYMLFSFFLWIPPPPGRLII